VSNSAISPAAQPLRRRPRLVPRSLTVTIGDAEERRAGKEQSGLDKVLRYAHSFRW